MMHFACLCCFVHPVQTYALDNKTLLAIEIPVMAVLEAKRYEGYKKTGEVRMSAGYSVACDRGVWPT